MHFNIRSFYNLLSSFKISCTINFDYRVLFACRKCSLISNFRASTQQIFKLFALISNIFCAGFTDVQLRRIAFASALIRPRIWKLSILHQINIAHLQLPLIYCCKIQRLINFIHLHFFTNLYMYFTLNVRVTETISSQHNLLARTSQTNCSETKRGL